MDSRMEHFKDVIKIRFPDFDLSSLDWSELDEFYKDHPEEIPIENESELDGAVKLGKRIVYVDELLDHIPESSPYVEN